VTVKRRITNRLNKASAPFLLLRALSESDGSVPLKVFQTMLGNLIDSKFGRRDCKALMTVEGFIETRVCLTPLGAKLVAEKLNPRKRTCEKSASTAAKKAIDQTVVPRDSTPLAQAWMGFR